MKKDYKEIKEHMLQAGSHACRSILPWSAGACYRSYRLEAHLTSAGTCYRSYRLEAHLKCIFFLGVRELATAFTGWKPILQVRELATALAGWKPAVQKVVFESIRLLKRT